MAQNTSEAQLLVRIQDLEQQIRTLTGQVEGLQFQLTQMQTMLQKQSEDNEFRFQQLEGGTPGKKPEAAVPTDGATPSDALPQGNAPAVATDLPVAPDAVPARQRRPSRWMAGIGQSADPLLGGGTDQLGTLSTDDPLSLDPSRPLGPVDRWQAPSPTVTQWRNTRRAMDASPVATTPLRRAVPAVHRTLPR